MLNLSDWRFVEIITFTKVRYKKNAVKQLWPFQVRYVHDIFLLCSEGDAQTFLAELPSHYILLSL